MNRKARIKILRGDLTNVGTYNLQYGQPFLDILSGKLFVGMDSAENTKLSNMPTIFQNNSGKIEIGNSSIGNTLTVDKTNNTTTLSINNQDFLNVNLDTNSTPNTTTLSIGNSTKSIDSAYITTIDTSTINSTSTLNISATNEITLKDIQIGNNRTLGGTTKNDNSVGTLNVETINLIV